MGIDFGSLPSSDLHFPKYDRTSSPRQGKSSTCRHQIGRGPLCISVDRGEKASTLRDTGHRECQCVHERCPSQTVTYSDSNVHGQCPHLRLFSVQAKGRPIDPLWSSLWEDHTDGLQGALPPHPRYCEDNAVGARKSHLS